MTLYEITDEINALEKLIESVLFTDLGEPREPTEEEQAQIMEMIGETEDAFRKKVEGICRFRANLKAQAEAFKNEESRLARRRRAFERKADALKMYMEIAMVKIKTDKVEAGLFRLRLQKNPPEVTIINMEALDAKYIRTIPETKEANKAEIKKDFEVGAYPWGAITQGKSIRIE